MWIYLPVVFVVADFQIGFLSGCPVDDEVISVSHFSFEQSGPFAVGLLRSTPGSLAWGSPAAAAEL